MVGLIVQNRNEEDLAKFFIIEWGLWSQRNEMIYEKTNTHLQAAIEKDLSTISFYKECNEVHNSKKKEFGWTPPPDDFLKFDTDGAMFFDQHQTGI